VAATHSTKIAALGISRSSPCATVLYTFERNLTALMFAYKQTATTQKRHALFAVNVAVR
jgi:hypothetical protein